MTFKYYHAENCNRFIESKGIRFAFEPYDYFGGTWRGLYATDKADEQMALDALVGSPNSAITETTPEHYEVKLKKKAPFLVNYNPLLTQPLRPAQPIIEGSRAVVVENLSTEPPKPTAAAEPLKRATDALVVGAVTVKADSKKK